MMKHLAYALFLALLAASAAVAAGLGTSCGHFTAAFNALAALHLPMAVWGWFVLYR